MKNAQLVCESGNSNLLKAPDAGMRPEPAGRAEGALPLVMLLGRKDEPTDAIRDYVSHLSGALEGQGIACQTWEMRWDERGWARTIAGFWKQSRAWRGRWVVLHYTALTWSRRGFPLAVPFLLKILELRRCRTAVVFHDLYPVANSRWIDRFRLFLQKRTMRHLAVNVQRAIVPVAPQLSGLPSHLPNCEFIPVGANVPSWDELSEIGTVPARNKTPTVAVFGITTWLDAQKREVAAIVESVRTACVRTGELQLIVLGRGGKEAEPLLRAGLSGTSVRLRVEDVCDAAHISSALCSSDVLLFVRGGFSTRRSSGLAAIACGLPLVAYRGQETGSPLTEAGVVFVPQDDVKSLGNELARVLLDRELRLRLRERNLHVFRDWFSWRRIADRWVAALGLAAEVVEAAHPPAKLLIYSADFWPTVGGVQSVVMALARGSANAHQSPQSMAQSMECTVVTETPAGAASDFDLPFRVMRNPSLTQLARLLWQADVVHVAAPALRPLILGLLLRKKIVVGHHGFHAVCPNGLLLHEPTRTACAGHFLAGNHRECWKCNRGLGYWASLRLWALTFFRRWSCRLASANVVPTHWLEGLLRLPHTRVIPHGVAEASSLPFPSAKKPKFAFVGRLVSTKGVELLLHAARELEKKNLEFELVIVGDGAERKRLEALPKYLGLSGITFAGQVADSELEEIISGAAAIVVPAIAGEVFGLVVAESMMRGRAVIVPDQGSLAEVAGGNGLKFAPGDAASLARCMESLLRSETIARELGDGARRHALAHFNLAEMLSRHFALHKDVLESGRHSG